MSPAITLSRRAISAAAAAKLVLGMLSGSLSAALVFGIRSIDRLVLLWSEDQDPAVVLIIKEYPRLGCDVIQEQSGGEVRNRCHKWCNGNSVPQIPSRVISPQEVVAGSRKST